MEGKNETRPICFPDVSAHDPWGIFNSGNLTYPNITRSELMNKPQNISQWRVTFVNPVGSSNSNITIGAILLKPLPSPGLQQTFYTCWISSGWGMSSASTSTGPGYDTGSGTTTGTDFSASPYQEKVSDHETYLFQDFPLRHISVTPEWADFLNPSVRNTNTTVVHILLTLFSFVSTEQIEVALGALPNHKRPGAGKFEFSARRKCDHRQSQQQQSHRREKLAVEQRRPLHCGPGRE
jgi:hypothetical protein